MESVSKRIDRIELAFAQTLKAQMKLARRLLKLEKRIDNIEKPSKGESCIGFFDDDITGDYLEGVR